MLASVFNGTQGYCKEVTALAIDSCSVLPHRLDQRLCVDMMMRCMQPSQCLHIGGTRSSGTSLVYRVPAAADASYLASIGGTPYRSKHGSTSRGQQLVVRSSVDPDELHENKLGPNVAAGIKDVKEGLTWKTATVIRNE